LLLKANIFRKEGAVHSLLREGAKREFRNGIFPVAVYYHLFLKLLFETSTQENLHLGHSYFKLGKFLKALECYKSVLERKPSTTVLMRAAQIEYDLGGYEAALQYYRKAVEIADKESLIERFERRIHLIENQIPYKQGQKIPRIRKRIFNLRTEARSLISAKKYVEAIRVYLELQDVCSLRADEALNVSIAYSKLGSYQKAEIYLESAGNSGLDEPSYLEQKAVIKRNTLELSEAEFLARKLNSTAPSQNSIMLLNSILFAKPDLEKALANYRDFFSEKRSGCLTDRYNYAICLRELGFAIEARSQFKQLPNSMTSVDGVGENIYACQNPTAAIARRKILSSNLPPVVAKEKISVILVTMRPELLAAAYETFCAQDYPKKEFIVVVNRADFSGHKAYHEVASKDSVKFIDGGGERTLGSLFSLGVSKATGTIIAKMDDDDEYGANYLSTSVVPLLSGKANLSGKSTRFVYLEDNDSLYLRRLGFADHDSVRNISGSSMIIRKSLIENLGWPDLQSGEDSEFLVRAREAGERIASTSEFGYLVNRRKDISTHTWQSDSISIRMSSAFIAKGKHTELVL
jgi:tetratricopeptide (TPR) repeat protein